MPVRSSRSSVLRWPDAAAVHQAAARWAEAVVRRSPQVRRVGYFGSYARGDWGVGSDLDLLLVVDQSDQPFTRRAAEWDVTQLPVPADLLVYTVAEWEALLREGRFGQTLAREVVWLYPAGCATGQKASPDSCPGQG
ncbi:MAG: nucleotidyltransferase domain-containing protein [Chloroflexi bacterium]|nr:nucleotidyltransferase domain-containing protein [Chloroflexota bacterium]